MPSPALGLVRSRFLLTVLMHFRRFVGLPFSLECIRLPMKKSIKIFRSFRSRLFLFPDPSGLRGPKVLLKHAVKKSYRVQRIT